MNRKLWCLYRRRVEVILTKNKMPEPLSKEEQGEMALAIYKNVRPYDFAVWVIGYRNIMGKVAGW